MKTFFSKQKNYLIAFSWANIFMLSEWLNLLAPPDNWSQYEFPLRSSISTMSVLIVVIFLGFGFQFILNSAKKNPKLQFLYRFIALLLLGFPFNRVRDSLNLTEWAPWISWSNAKQALTIYGAVSLIATFFLIFTYLAWKQRKKFNNTIDALFLIFAPFIILTFLRALGGYFNGDLNQERSLAVFHDQNTAPMGRVVWMIFDELDYRLVFEKRPAGIEFKNWDAILNSSISFTNAYPPGDNTIVSVPSLTLGRTIASFNPEGLDNASFTFANNHSELAYWKTSSTIFHEMQKNNANTAIVGWFHGYCRIFAPIVQSCERASRVRYSYEPTILGNLINIPRRMFPLKRGQEVHIHAHKNISRAAIRAVPDPRFQFVYLHLPIPHPPFIYDRKKKKISEWVTPDAENYFGNVELTDQFLGTIKQLMQENGTWDTTTLILTSDHHWRGSASYDGQVDHRVPLIIKPAFFKTGKKVDQLASSNGIFPFALSAIQEKGISAKEVEAFMTNPAIAKTE